MRNSGDKNTLCVLSVALLNVGLCWVDLSAQSARFELFPQEIYIGDPVNVKVDLQIPPGSQVVLPLRNEWEPGEVIKVDTLTSEANRLTVEFHLGIYQVGEINLPKVPFIVFSSQKMETLWVGGETIRVKSLLEASQDTSIRDVKPPVTLPLTWKEILPYILSIVFLGALGWGGYLIWRRWQQRKGILPTITLPPPPPHIKALRRLEELRSRRLWQNGLIKEYYSELSDILREYIEGRFSLNAQEMTTFELLSYRQQWCKEDETFNQVRKFLIVSDLTKFARFVPPEKEHDHYWETVRSYITQTKPLVEEKVTETKES